MYYGLMVQSITGIRKKRGRPATGSDPQVIVRLPSAVIEAIDARAAENGVTRSEAIRRLLELALAKAGKR